MIYVLAELGQGRKPNGMVKIGFTGGDSSTSRCAGCQTGNPRPLTVWSEYPGDERDERRVHRALAAWRLQGEWFSLTSRAIRLLQEAKRQPLDLVVGQVVALQRGHARVIPGEGLIAPPHPEAPDADRDRLRDAYRIWQRRQRELGEAV